MTSEKRLKTARVISVIAATFISLACGSNYAYSAWAPEFAGRMKLSSTQSNLIGTFANLGMYASGVPIGLFVDSKGPRPSILVGAVLMGLGYTVLQRAYDHGPGSMAMPWLCFFACLTGVGGCASFAGSIKTSALNWPNHRGSATAFPLSAYGLSAFFFSSLSSLAFHNDPARFLILLAVGTFSMAFIGFFFLHVVPHSTAYSALPVDEERERSRSNPMMRTRSEETKYSTGRMSQEPGTQPTVRENSLSHENASRDPVINHEASGVPETDTDETSSLISGSSIPGDVLSQGEGKSSGRDSHRVDIRGFRMLPTLDFWKLFLLLGILTGVGLMTINNVGNNATALWNYYDDSASLSFIQGQQMMYVSVLSVMSCCGRLLSGVGSDLIVKKFQMSRFWCLFTSSFIFCVAQICGAQIRNPHMLTLLSALTGLAYGFLYGVFPSLVAETFGINGLSQNWGWMTLSPIIFGNIFNLLYGRIYDSHSVILPDGERDCREALNCYSAAYWITFGGSTVGLLLSLWCIWHVHVIKLRATKDRNLGREA